MWTSLPLFGTAALLAVMLAASYTFAVALVAGSDGRPRTLQAARFGAYGTVTLVGVAVLCLAYAFVTHDFRLRYVTAHSDRSMPMTGPGATRRAWATVMEPGPQPMSRTEVPARRCARR